MSYSLPKTTAELLKKSKEKNNVVSFGIDRRVKRQLEKMSQASGMTPSDLTRFFLSKRCIAPNE